MPYIIQKRSDIRPGVLQILDLLPNTSQRNQTIDPPGQSKYIRTPLNDQVITVGAGPVTLYQEARGLAAWFITNVPAVDAVQASQVGQVDGGGLSPTETFTIGAVVLTAVAAAPAAGEFIVTGDQVGDAQALADAINDPANGLEGIVSAEITGVGEVTVTAVEFGTGGNTIATTETSATFAWGGATLTGGVNGVSLTATQANTIATNIFANLLKYDDPTSALDLDLTAVNAEITAVVATSGLEDAQLLEILDILSGRLYVVPQGTQVEDGSNIWVVSPPVGTEGGPDFIDPSFRRSYETDSFVISWGTGSLSKFRSDTFSYLEVVGALVAVYNDDGTLYTPPLV